MRVLLAAGGDAPIAVCRYDDGRGYPLAVARELFDDLRALPGEKAIWRLLGRHEDAVTEVPVAGRVPLEVDSWADYEEVVAAGWTWSNPRAIVARGGPGRTDPWMEKGVTRLTGWQVGIALGVVVILVAAVIVITIVRSGGPHRRSRRRPRSVRSTCCATQTDELAGIERINDSGVRILHSARALRKVAVGR